MQRWTHDRDLESTNVCDNCDGQVSPRFRELYSDERGRIHRCPDCCVRRSNLSRTARGLEPRNIERSA